MATDKTCFCCETGGQQLLEFKSAVSLFCSFSGSSLFYRWLNGNSEVTASNGIQLSDGNSTLTIVNVTRYNDGPFSCDAFNAVSTGTTEPLHLNISYGPDGVSFTVFNNRTMRYSNVTRQITISSGSVSVQLAINGKKCIQ
eukprot:XP_014013166.1 PREDICTED: carcinoembryonic antigen-related cell adhesion molecule 1-like [Salmo salar]